jgi:hypothetical protein
MRPGFKFAGLVVAGVLCLSVLSVSDTSHKTRKSAKKQPAPLPSGPQGPIPQVPLDSVPASQPQVSYQNGQLSIVAPNSTLGDILRAVRKQTDAEMDIPSNATERVATHLGPGPAREVMAELLNGSRFNYVLLGSQSDANLLTRVVLVAKSGADTPGPNPQPGQPGLNQPPIATMPQDAANVQAEPEQPETADETSEENQDQANEAEQPAPPEPPGIKTPQQLLQEMQQRQLQMQQQQPGQPPLPGQAYPQQVPPQPPQQQPQQE